MVFQPINFLNAPLVKSPFENLTETLSKGYQFGEALRERPGQMQRQREKEELANVLAGIQSKYAGPMAEAKLGLLGAQTTQAKTAAQKAQVLADILAHFQKRGFPQGANQGAITQEDQPRSQEVQIPYRAQAETISSQAQTAQPSQPQLQHQDYAMAALTQALTGLGKPEIKDIDGTLTAITPFGNYVVGQGMTPSQKEYLKADVKGYEGLQKANAAAAMSKPTFDALSEVTSDPEFQAMRQSDLAPKLELSFYKTKGTPIQKELAGKFETYTNQLIKDSARDFAGQFRIGEQELLESMKPSSKDTLDVMLGKLEGLMQLRSMMQNRTGIAMNLMRNRGMSLNDSLNAADSQVDSKAIKKSIKDQLAKKEYITIRNNKTGESKRILKSEASKYGIKS